MKPGKTEVKDDGHHKARFGTTPGGRNYVSKRKPDGTKYTEVKSKRVTVIKNTSEGKSTKTAIPNYVAAKERGFKTVKKGPTKKAKK